MLLHIPCRAHYITYACPNPYFLIAFLSSCSFFSMSLVNLSRHPRPFRSTVYIAIGTKDFTEYSCYFIPVLMCLWLSGSNFFSQGKVILYAWPSKRSHLGNKCTFMHSHIITNWLLFYFIYRSLTTK